MQCWKHELKFPWTEEQDDFSNSEDNLCSTLWETDIKK